MSLYVLVCMNVCHVSLFMCEDTNYARLASQMVQGSACLHLYNGT